MNYIIADFDFHTIIRITDPELIAQARIFFDRPRADVIAWGLPNDLGTDFILPNIQRNDPLVIEFEQTFPQR